jgi:DUF1680 family protein
MKGLGKVLRPPFVFALAVVGPGAQAKKDYALRPVPFTRVTVAAVALNLDKGFVRIRRNWKKGDVVELSLPMPVGRVLAHEAVKDDIGMVALERGPIVYCAEGVDNGGRALSLALPDEMPLKAEYRADLLKGIVVVKGRALAANKSEGTAAGKTEQKFLAIPYYAWANRGAGEMAVWLARK